MIWDCLAWWFVVYIGWQACFGFCDCALLGLVGCSWWLSILIVLLFAANYFCWFLFYNLVVCLVWLYWLV